MVMTGIQLTGFERLLRRLAVQVLITAFLLASGRAARAGARLITEPERQYGWGAIWDTALSPDGTRILLSCRDGRVRLIEAAGGQLIQTLEEPRTLLSMTRFSPDGTKALTVSGNASLLPRAVALWDLATGQKLWQSEAHPGEIAYLDWSRDGSRVLTGTNAAYETGAPVYDANLRLFDAATGQKLRTFSETTQTLTAAAFSPDGARCLSARYDGSIRIYDLTTSASQPIVIKNSGSVENAFFTPDRQGVVSADSSGAKVWSIASRAVTRTIATRGARAFTPDGTGLLFKDPEVWPAGKPGCLMMDFATGQTRFSLPWELTYVVAPFSGDGSRLLTRARDLRLKICDARTGEVKQDTPTSGSFHQQTIFTPDGSQFLTFIPRPGKYAFYYNAKDADNRARLAWFDSATGNAVRTVDFTLPAGTTDMRLRAFSPDQSRFMVYRYYDIMGSYTSVMEMRDTATGAALWTAKANEYRGGEVCFSPDGSKALISSYNEARFVNAADGQLIRRLTGHTQLVWTTAISPDGTRALTSAMDNTIRLWNLETGEQLHMLNLGDMPDRIAFSPNGRRILTFHWAGFVDHVMRLWNADLTTTLWTATGTYLATNGVTFSPDGSKIVTLGGNAILWDAATGQEICQFTHRFNNGSVYARSATFSPDSATLLTAHDDGAARLWRIPVPSAAGGWGGYQ